MSTILAENNGSIRTLTLNRPDKRNALNDALIADLKAALREADTDESLLAVVIRGAGKDFCSGADLSALQKIATASYEENIEDARSLADLFALIRSVRVPVIAAVHGRALAGGCGLALGCDLVVAGESARFGFSEVKIGFVPAMVAAILRRNLGEKKSFELLTQGFEFTAGEALQLGLINRVAPDDKLTATVMDLASVYAKVSGSAVAMTKRLLHDIDADTYQTAIEKGVTVNATARMTDDCRREIAKFLEK
ncbi:MAG: enoyl-CoA hydratase/isomerase family protein [Pyrinomonadaceae bacterium]|nr:enoyl-CoA hydratase/isomerase family protein [Pyrinomonadaceae bacterium]MBP6211979.1 enoyl-CoA hydratase/isomerase family protein [Pyrinomonadaceae bacterium]